MPNTKRHRDWIILRGPPPDTHQSALELVSHLDPTDVLWVSNTRDTAPPDHLETVEPTDVRKLLGRAFDAVVLDLHHRFDADVVGQCHGLIWGGGGLVLRFPPEGTSPDGIGDALAAHPYDPDDVGTRFWHRFERRLDAPDHRSIDPWEPPSHEVTGTDDQAAAIERMTDLFARTDAPTVALLADRGRGKSSALGIAIRRYLDHRPDDDGPPIAVTARYPDAADEVFAFAGAGNTRSDAGPVRFTPVADLLGDTESFALIVLDEAAQIPVPTLRRIVGNHPHTPIAFSSTTHGYEGTGRGFEIRFVDWLTDGNRPHETLRLEEPIRWCADDPLERAIFDALLLDAEPAVLDPSSTERDAGSRSVELRQLDRDALAGDETKLRQFFGLLIQAHYRTTPRDLHRMLDAPNLQLHALLRDGDVVAATWAAEEGDLPESLTDDVYWGRHRMRGHALPEILVGNLAHRSAGECAMVRSVRIAVHPDARRRGLGTRLVEHVHDTYAPDLFGTVFGATPGLLAFRRNVGYEVVQMSPSHGIRAGEPSVTMLRPASERGRRLVETLRAEFAHRLPIQLDLMHADDDLEPPPDLRHALTAGLPDPPPPLDDERIRRVVDHFAHGPSTYESAAFAVEPFVESHADRLDQLGDDHRRLIDARVRRRRSWSETTEYASQPSVRATMRALRRAVRELVDRVDPAPNP